MAFIIVYPRGNETCISVAEIGDSIDKIEYRLASRREFQDRDEAVPYARKLAKDYALTYEGDPGDHNYLD